MTDEKKKVHLRREVRATYEVDSMITKNKWEQIKSIAEHGSPQKVTDSFFEAGSDVTVEDPIDVDEELDEYWSDWEEEEEDDGEDD